MTDSWKEIQAWRKVTRKALIARRRELRRRDKLRCDGAIVTALEELSPRLADRCVGFYWPLNGEVDLISFMRRTVGKMREAALPVVIGKEQPLEFWRWSARTKLCARGLWNIPSPIERSLVNPDVLLVPLVGFDEESYRLGYGTGYYDRTLAAAPGPLTIGIGYEMASLRSIYPQPHDIPMDLIVTERGIRWCSRIERVGPRDLHTGPASLLPP
jgi:5-formyltetrahydrofolate cyclo-ligase